MSQRPSYEELADYRRRVAEMYARVRRSGEPPEEVWRAFVGERDELFRQHPQSALDGEHRWQFSGLDYYPYNPDLRMSLAVEPVEHRELLEIHLEDDGILRLERVGRVRFAVNNEGVQLTLFWLRTYGGGLFLPFRDTTNKDATYGGGRYLLDTIKGADLGHDGARLVMDFNYAYNPTCAYNPRWHCPLAPPENWLQVPITAGELRYARGQGREQFSDSLPAPRREA